MNKLEKWAHASEFTAIEMVKLINGNDPHVFQPFDFSEKDHIFKLAEFDYFQTTAAAVAYVFECDNTVFNDLIFYEYPLCSIRLGEAIKRVRHTSDHESFLEEIEFLLESSIFSEQQFKRWDVSQWALKRNIQSHYDFSRAVDSVNDVDPSEFPEELDIANIAYRYIVNQASSPDMTVKESILNFLNSNWPHLSSASKIRIATIANTDKLPGRRPSKS